MKHKTRFSAFLLGTALLATPIGAEGLIQQEINKDGASNKSGAITGIRQLFQVLYKQT